MTDEEMFAAYADWCGITVDELMSYLDCYESRKQVGLHDPFTNAHTQIGLLMGRTCDRCHQLREAKHFTPDAGGLSQRCIQCTGVQTAS